MAAAVWKVTFVVPCYNERKTIESVVSRIRSVPFPHEIVVVDDASTDGTAQVLKEKVAPVVDKVLTHERNQGKGAALRTGFAAATGDFVIVQDADMEYDPRDVESLLRPILDGEADVVYGSRFLAGGRTSTIWHLAANRGLTMLSNLFTGLRLTDMETCYKLFKRELIQSIPIEEDRFGFEPEVTAKIAARKCRVRELPISYNARGYQHGKKIGWKDGVRAIYCILKYHWAS